MVTKLMADICDDTGIGTPVVTPSNTQKTNSAIMSNCSNCITV